MSTGLDLFHVSFILFCVHVRDDKTEALIKHFTDDKTESNLCKDMMPIDGRISNCYSAKRATIS